MDDVSPLGPLRPHADQLVRSMSAEFERAIYARAGRPASPDPVLATLFHAFAVHLERLYDEAEESFPIAILDDLLSGLALQPRVAHPAQTVLSFSEIQAREALPSEMPVVGIRLGEELTFSVDQVIELATSRLAFAGVVEKGVCHVLGGAIAPRTGAFIPPSRAPLRAVSPSVRSIFLGVETDARHLSGLGLYLQLATLDRGLSARICGAPWILLDAEGVRRQSGVMRTAAGPGGAQVLHWNDDASPPSIVPHSAPAGVFGPAVFVFPEIPTDRRWRGKPPACLDACLSTLVPDAPDAYKDANLAWIEIPVQPGPRDVASLLERVILNCTLASNIENIDQTIRFQQTGASLSLRPESRDDRHVLAVLSVVGENSHWYVPEEDIEAILGAGTYRLRRDLLEIVSHKSETKRDRSVNVRLRLTDGSRGNDLGVGELQLRGSLSNNPVLQVKNLVAARGGAEPAPFADARVRFADLVRTRERIVTKDDIESTVRAFDARIRDVTATTMPLMTNGVLEFVDRVNVVVPAESLADADAEAVTIQRRLFDHLNGRWMAGRKLSVEVSVAAGAAR